MTVFKDTQANAIYQYVREHGSITPIQASRELGITKLATRISEMTRSGKYSVKKTPVVILTRYGHTRVMRYSNIVKKRRAKNESK